MKKMILLALGVLFSITTFAQERVFCEIVERVGLTKSVKVTIDFGQKREKSKWQQSLVNENGENIIFNSKIDALNHMNKLGWQFLQAYTVTSGSGESITSQVHWVLYKDVIKGEDPYNGIITKEIHDKGNK